MSSTNLRPTATTAVDDAALDQQVRSFLEGRPLIEAHIRALTRDRALADDVFQEVWLRFEKATRHGQLILNVTAWCRATARLVALEAWREQSRHRSVPDEELSALVDKAYEEQDGGGGFWQEHSDALAHCLEALPPKLRNLATRRYHTGQSVAQIAAELGQSLGSTKTALCRMRAALSECAHKRLLQLHSSL
jgi:RNA polymerase sigma-70 factor (ECF subfamily)